MSLAIWNIAVDRFEVEREIGDKASMGQVSLPAEVAKKNEKLFKWRITGRQSLGNPNKALSIRFFFRKLLLIHTRLIPCGNEQWHLCHRIAIGAERSFRIDLLLLFIIHSPFSPHPLHTHCQLIWLLKTDIVSMLTAVVHSSLIASSMGSSLWIACVGTIWRLEAMSCHRIGFTRWCAAHHLI